MKCPDHGCVREQWERKMAEKVVQEQQAMYVRSSTLCTELIESAS